MDPFSLATGIAGLISLAKDVSEVIQPYIRDVASASSDISQLQLQVRALGEVLEKLKSLLESEDADELLFESDSALELVRRNCQARLTAIYKRLKRKKAPQPRAIELVAVIPTQALPTGSSGRVPTTQEPATVGLLDRLIWPFQKTEVLASCAKVQEYIQTFSFCLSIANCKTLSNSSRLVVKMLQEQEGQLSAVARIISPVPEQVAQSLKELQSVVAAVSAVTQELRGISAEIQVVTAEVERKKFDEILHWISPNETGKRHEAFREIRTIGTCREFFSQAGFKAWSGDDPAHRILCCVGAPGVGKSILCSAVVDELRGPSGKYPVCCHYFEYQTQGSQTTVAVMRQLLRQLLESTKSIPEDLKLVYDTVGRRSKPPTVEETVTFISQISGRYDQVYVCIDGLDECENLAQLLNTVAMCPSNARVFLSGRRGVEMAAQRRFPQLTVLDIQAQDKDVRLFLTHEIRQNMLRYPELMDINLESEIVSHLAESSGGLFLLASLHIANILAEPTKRKRREVLNKPPKNLHDVYISTIKRILDQGKARADQAMEVLAWVYLAERPLSLAELRHGLATEIDDPDFDSDNLPADSFLSECLGLVLLDAETGLLRLVHLSLLEFFESEKTLQAFQETLASKCLTYMLFDSTAVELTGNWLRNWEFRHLLWGEETEATNLPSLIIRFPLLKYASCYWGDHARKSGTNSTEGRDRIRKYILLPSEKMQPSVACFMAGPLVSKLQYYVPISRKQDSEEEHGDSDAGADRHHSEDEHDGSGASNGRNGSEDERDDPDADADQEVSEDEYDGSDGSDDRSDSKDERGSDVNNDQNDSKDKDDGASPPPRSRGLFRMRQNNADPHALRSHFPDLFDPPDLQASLHEEQLLPRAKDMNPSEPDLVPHEQELRFDDDPDRPKWVWNPDSNAGEFAEDPMDVEDRSRYVGGGFFRGRKLSTSPTPMIPLDLPARSPSPSPYRDPTTRWQWRRWEPPRAHILAFFGLYNLWSDGDAKNIEGLDLHAGDGWNLSHDIQSDGWYVSRRIWNIESRLPVSYAILRGDISTVDWILSQHNQQGWRCVHLPCSCTLWRNITAELGHDDITSMLLQCRQSHRSLET